MTIDESGLASANGIGIHYHLEGSGSETIVLINGLADDLETWSFQMPDLIQAGYRVLRFDNRGIGRTSQPAGPYTTALLARDTKQLIDELGIERPHLVGISMGGMIAQEYALAHGEDLWSLTLACTYAAPGPFCSRLLALWAETAPLVGVPAIMRDVMLRSFTASFFEERPEELGMLEAELAGHLQPVEAYLAQLNAIRCHEAVDRLRGIDVPTLVLAAEEDTVIPVHLSRRIAERIPGAQWRTIPGGHACSCEHPKAFNSAVLDFLRVLRS